MKIHYRAWPKVAGVYVAVYAGVLIVAAAHWGLG